MKIAIYHPKGGSGRSTLTLALADYLKFKKNKAVEIVETDVQKTIRNSVEVGFQKRHVPVSSAKASADYIIYDGAPYTKDRTHGWLKKMNIIIVPVVVSPNDATSLAQTLPDIPPEAQKNTFIVFNRVVKPYRSSYKKVAPLILDIIKSSPIKKATTEISYLEAFSLIGGAQESTLIASTSSGKKALSQIESLAEELKIIQHL